MQDNTYYLVFTIYLIHIEKYERFGDINIHTNRQISLQRNTSCVLGGFNSHWVNWELLIYHSNIISYLDSLRLSQGIET